MIYKWYVTSHFLCKSPLFWRTWQTKKKRGRKRESHSSRAAISRRRFVIFRVQPIHFSYFPAVYFIFFFLCRIFTLVRPECPGGSSLHPKFSLFFSQLLPDSVLLGAGCCVQDLVSFSRPECFDISHSVMARHAHSRGLNDQKGSAQIRAHCRQYTSAFPTAVSSPESATLSVNVKKGKPKNEKKKKRGFSYFCVPGRKKKGWKLSHYSSRASEIFDELAGWKAERQVTTAATL